MPELEKNTFLVTAYYTIDGLEHIDISPNTDVSEPSTEYERFLIKFVPDKKTGLLKVKKMKYHDPLWD